MESIAPPFSLSSQGTLEFPRGDLGAVLIPLDFFGFDVLAIGMVAQDLFHQGVFFELQNRLMKVVRHIRDALGFSLFRGQREDIVVDGFRCLVVFQRGDAIEARGENRGQSEIRIRGRIHAADLRPSALAPRRGDADHRGAVRITPANVARGFVTGDETFIRIDNRIR